MKKLMLILFTFLVCISLFTACSLKKDIAASTVTASKAYKPIYPIVDKTIMNEIKDGKHDSFFDPELVAYEYLETLYPKCEKKILSSNEIEDKEITYVFSVENQSSQIKLVLQKVNLYNDISIWVVVDK